MNVYAFICFNAKMGLRYEDLFMLDTIQSLMVVNLYESYVSRAGLQGT